MTDILTDQQKKELLKLRFVDGLKLKEIGLIFDVSREAIRQRIEIILKKLRENQVKYELHCS